MFSINSPWSAIIWINHTAYICLHMIIILPAKCWLSFKLITDVIQYRSGLTFAHIMAICLPTPRDYLNYNWLIVNEVLWNTPISQEVLKISIRKMMLKNTLIKLLPHPSWVGELTHEALNTYERFWLGWTTLSKTIFKEIIFLCVIKFLFSTEF